MGLKQAGTWSTFAKDLGTNNDKLINVFTFSNILGTLLQSIASYALDEIHPGTDACSRGVKQFVAVIIVVFMVAAE